MPTCPNCGTIVLEGEPYCSHCGATFVWYDDEDDAFESPEGKWHREYITPYDIDFFNELYNSQTCLSEKSMRCMGESLTFKTDSPAD